MEVVIVGSYGAMGKWFARFFRKNNLKVTGVDRKTKNTNKKIAKADIVLISVPIDKTVQVIKEIGPHVRENALLMDVTSLKERPVKAMLKYSKSEVIGTHPVFGPHLPSMKNQTVVVCPQRSKKHKPWLMKLLKKNGAKIKITTPKYHDQMMATIQGVIHFSTITIGHVLKEFKIDIKQSQQLSSPIYKLRLDMVGRILNQNPRLYANIEIENPHTPKALKAYLQTCKSLYRIVQKRNTKAFVKYFNQAADYLGDFKKEAETFSNYVIKKLVEK